MWGYFVNQPPGTSSCDLDALAKRYAAEIIRCALDLGAWTHADLPHLSDDNYQAVTDKVRELADLLELDAGQTGHFAWWAATHSQSVAPEMGV